MNDCIEMYSINVLCTRKMFILTFKSAQKLWTICINVWTSMCMFSCNGHANSCNLMHVRTLNSHVNSYPYEHFKREQ
jgi:hypothetical protein